MAAQMGKRNAKKSSKSTSNDVGIEDLVAICSSIGTGVSEIYQQNSER